MSQLKTMKSSPNPMQRPRIAKVVVNMSIGKSGEILQNAMKVFQQLTDQTPYTRKAKKTIREWGITRGTPIACVGTLRGEKATDFLKKGFDALRNKLSKSTFDSNGNFSFGIREHIELPGVRYDPNLGIFGMDVCVTMERPGYHVKKRRKCKAKVGRRQRITPSDSMEYIKEVFNIELE
jgi:large subunit ribosomal protein L5